MAKEHDHKHDHKNHHEQHSRRKPLHHDWRAWVVVVLMLAAMAIYVMSQDESIVPGSDKVQQPVPAAPDTPLVIQTTSTGGIGGPPVDFLMPRAVAKVTAKRVPTPPTSVATAHGADMLADDENPYRASSADLNSPEPLEPLTPLPAETLTQRRGKWCIALGIAGALYGTVIAAAFSGVLAIVVAARLH